MNVPLLLRVVVILIFLATMIISLVAIFRKRRSYYLVGVVVWSMNVIIFTVAATLRAEEIVIISPDAFSMWASVVRIQGGIVALILAIYGLERRSIL